ncbi:WD40 repeats protein, partial [Rhizoctonia solani]
MSLIAVTTSQGLSVISSSALQASNPNPAPIFTAALTPPSRIPSSCISWSYDGSSIFVASGGSVSAYDPTSGAWLRDVIREGEGGIGGAKLGAMAVIDGPDTPGLMLALARGPRAVIFDTEARRAVLTIEGHKSSIQAMSVTCDQSLLATCSGDSTMVTNIPQQSTVVLRGAPAGALAAAFHPSRRTTLLILSPKGLHVFDTTKGGAPIRTIPISKVEGTSASIAFSSSTSSLVAVALPGRDSRVVLLDIDKDSSLLKKFNVEENVTAMSFSHDGATIIVTSETGRVMQLNLRSTDAPSQAVAVDPAGGRIGGMALVAESPTSSNTLPRARPARTDSLPNLPTADSLRIKASVSDLRGGTLRKRPSTLDIGPKSPESPRISSPETLRNRSPQLARTKSSVADLHKRSPSGDLKTKVSPGALRVKAGVENKVRPTSMISAGSGKERVRVRPMSLVDQQSEGEGLSKATRDTISRASRPSLADLKTAAGTPSPGSKASSANGSPLTKNDRESTISPTSRRQTQTMPRRLTSDGSRPPTIAQIFAQDDAASAMRTRSPSQSTVPLSAVSSQSSLSNGRSTPLSTRPSLRSTTPNYTPGVPAGSATSDEPEEQILVPRPGDRERPWSRLGEERARSRLGNETPKLPTLPAIEDRPRSRIGTEDRPRSRAFEDRLVSESERERPSSRLFRDGTDRPASRAGTLGASGSATLGLGRPTGLARRFSTDLKPAPEAMRVVSESGITRERAETFGSLRDRPEPVLKKRASAIFREQSDALFRERERERSSTPLSGSSTRNSGKRVGWVDTESPYVSAPLDTIYTPARPRSGLANNSVSGSNSSDEDESDCAHRGSNALLVTPRRGLAAALGAEVYAGETPTNKGNSTSMTKTQAQDLLRNIVSDVMFEFRQETKEDVRGLHLDLLRASRGWKSDLKEYLGDTLEELRLVKEENARLRAEIARLRRGY